MLGLQGCYVREKSEPAICTQCDVTDAGGTEDSSPTEHLTVKQLPCFEHRRCTVNCPTGFHHGISLSPHNSFKAGVKFSSGRQSPFSPLGKSPLVLPSTLHFRKSPASESVLKGDCTPCQLRCPNHIHTLFESS